MVFGQAPAAGSAMDKLLPYGLGFLLVLAVLLWLARGSSGVGQEGGGPVLHLVFAAAEPRHRVLALECLADAKRINVELADRVIDHFLTRLGWGGRDSEAIIRGVGAVAADSRPRGNKVLELLTGLARSPAASGRASAFRALAASGRVEAARVLVLSRTDNTADPAAPSYDWVWRNATKFRVPQGVVPAGQDLAGVSYLSGIGVWRPFASNTSAAMLAIAGRIAYLLDKGPVDLIPQDTECIDTRISLPIAALGIKSDHLPYRYYKGLTKQLAEEFVNEERWRMT